MEKKTWSTHPILCVFLLYLFCTSKLVAGQNIPIRVAVVLERDDYGNMVFSCISMALYDVYSTHDHYKTQLVLTNSGDSKGDVVGPAAAVVDLLKNVEVQAIIGPMFSAMSPSLTSTQTPYFIRATTNDSSQVSAIGALVKDLNFPSAKSTIGLTKWSGNVSSSPNSWVTPTNGKTLTVGVPVNPGFVEYVRVTWNSNNSTKVERYCIDVFDAVLRALPYGATYEYIPFATSDHVMVGDYNDLIYQVNLGNFDAVAGDVTILKNRSRIRGKNSWMFMKPLTWQLWITIFCSFIFIGVLVWLPEHQTNKDFRHPFWYQVGIVWWFAFSTIVFAHRRKVVSNSTRLVLIIWFMVVFILTQRYTTSFSSMLKRFSVDVFNSKKVEGYRIDVLNAAMASLPIGYLVWVLEHQINKYFRHPFWHQLGMTMWFAFSAYVFSHSGTNSTWLVLITWFLVVFIFAQRYIDYSLIHVNTSEPVLSSMVRIQNFIKVVKEMWSWLVTKNV